VALFSERKAQNARAYLLGLAKKYPAIHPLLIVQIDHEREPWLAMN
jgi:hypothetical protein